MAPAPEPADTREIQQLDPSTITDRILRANDEIVPAGAHTQAAQLFQASMQQPSSENVHGGNKQVMHDEYPVDQKLAVHMHMPAGDSEMQKFLRGFRRFHKTYFHENTSLFSKLQHGQAPKTLLIGCCDSRCDPAIITDCDPGDLFVIRNVANLVPPYIPNEDQRHHGTSAAVEFAVKGLGVETIIVLGHTACGGINALMNTDLTGKNYEFISSWMAIATPAKERTLREFADADEETQRIACEHASILLSLENLMGYPFIRERLDKDQISVNGWYFDFKRGDLMAYNPDTHAFETMATPESPERQGSGRDVARKASVRDVGGTACALPVP